jgi:hypothetical protein
VVAAVNFATEPVDRALGDALAGPGRLVVSTDPGRRACGEVGLDTLMLAPGEGVLVEV